MPTMPLLTRPQKITFSISADQRPDDVRIKSSGTGSAGAGAEHCEGAFGWRDVFHVCHPERLHGQRNALT